MSLRDPVRSFWISTLDCLRIFGVSISRRIFFLKSFFHTIFFPFPFYFWGFLNKDLLFFSIGLFFKIYSFPSTFSSPGWKAGDHGSWIHLRCSLPVFIIWGGGACCSFQAPPPWSRRWKSRWMEGLYRCLNLQQRRLRFGPVQPSSSGWCSLWHCWSFPAQLWLPESPPPSAPPTTSTISTTSMVLCPLPSTGCPSLHVGAMVRHHSLISRCASLVNH